MKKFLFTLFACVLVLCSCSNDDETSFNYDMGLLYGTWRVTEVQQNDGSFLDVTSTIAEKVFKPTYATFKEDRTYTGRGEFGNGSGTYKAEGNTIYTYIGDTEYLRYEVVNLSGNKCHLIMKQTGSTSTIEIICTKQ